MLAHMARPRRIEPGPGQESVWDYPRPPRIEPSGELVEVIHAGHLVARTTRALRVLETSQAPGYYLPVDDVDSSVLTPSATRTHCEWKGVATYWTLAVSVADHLAFYPQLVDECRVDGEVVAANEGGFYGGWVTSRVVGPFKGGAGSWGW
jgi:uncharacterized protein (DUF427 family)